MSKSGVEAYIYLDFYSDEIYTEDEINKITGVDCSKATFESPLIVKPNQINGVSFTVATEDAENIRHRIFPILSENRHFDGDVITNPPYKIALECLEHSYEIINEGNRVAMFLRLQFLEGVARRKFFDVHPPKVVYVPSHRLCCAMNGDFENYHASAMALCWFIWEKGFTGDPIVRWFN